MQAKDPPHNTEMLEFCTTATWAINRLSGIQATPSTDVVDCGCSKIAANTALPLAKVGPSNFTVGRIALGAFFPVELLQELNVLGIIGVLEHLTEWQPWVAPVLHAWDVDMSCAVLPVIVTAIEVLDTAFDSALMVFDAKMDALVTFEVLRPLEPAVTASPVAVLPLDRRTADRFALAGKSVELITLDDKIAVVRTPDDEVF